MTTLQPWLRIPIHGHWLERAAHLDLGLLPFLPASWIDDHSLPWGRCFHAIHLAGLTFTIIDIQLSRFYTLAGFVLCPTHA
jgi:hypothetical protein